MPICSEEILDPFSNLEKNHLLKNKALLKRQNIKKVILLVEYSVIILWKKGDGNRKYVKGISLL